MAKTQTPKANLATSWEQTLKADTALIPKGRDMHCKHEILQAIAEEEEALGVVLLRLEETIARRDALRETIAGFKAQIAPIRRLPIEILSMIFSFYAKDKTGPRPFVLGLVCRHWRNVQIGTPSLWTHLHVFILSDHLTQLGPWIVRAGSHPLDLKIDFRLPRVGHHFNTEFRPSAETWATICQKVYSTFKTCNIGRLHIINMDCRLTTPVIQLVTKPLSRSQVESLYLELPGMLRFVSPDVIQEFHHALEKSSGLTTLSMAAELIPPSTALLARLQHVDVDSVEDTLKTDDHFSLDDDYQHEADEEAGAQEFVQRFQTIMRSLSSSTVLTRLSIGGTYDPTNEFYPTDLPQSVFSTVEVLRVENIFDPTLFFTRLRFPNLRRLTTHELSFGGTSTQWMKVLLQGQHSSRDLRALTFGDWMRMKDSDLIWGLERLPLLEELGVPSDRFTEKFVEAFTRKATTRKGWLCPNLRELVVGMESLYYTKINQKWRKMRPLVETRVYNVPGHPQVPQGKKANKNLLPPVPLERVEWHGEDLILKFRNPDEEAADVNLIYGEGSEPVDGE